MFLIQQKKTVKKLEFSYSLKNIPIPSKIEYQKALTDRVEKFLALSLSSQHQEVDEGPIYKIPISLHHIYVQT